jgi:hypothetical protein
MTANILPTLVGDWNITRARDIGNPLEATTLSIREDPAGNLLLDGLSPVAGGPDMIFSGNANADITAWMGTVSLPGYNPYNFMFVLNNGGAEIGGWVIEPNNGQTTAWVGTRV